MQRVAAFVGTLGLAAAAGGLAIADLVVVPGLMGQSVLLDPNQATTLVGPLHMRCAEVALAGTLVAALAIPRWLGSRVATTVSLLAIACAAISRLLVLPRVYEAWGRVDLVAGRPVSRLVEAEQLAHHTLVLDVCLAALLVLLIALVTAAARPSLIERAAAAAPAARPEMPATGASLADAPHAATAA